MSGNNTFTVALKLLTLGFAVIPSGGGDSGKAPRVNWQTYQEHPPTDDELETWQRDLRPTLWGIVTGPVSGVVVVDADTVEARAEIEATGLEPHITTPRGGAHFYFKHPGYHVKTVAGLLPGVDVRADGGFVNAVGNRADGKYKIEHLPTPDNLYPWDKLPAPIRAATDGKKPRHSTSTIVTPIAEGQRNQRLTSLAGGMRRRDMPQTAIEVALLEVNATQCQPPLPEDEVRRIARSVARYEPKAPGRGSKPAAGQSFDDAFPEIVVNARHLRDITAHALEALDKANSPPRVFRRGGALTRVSLDEKQRSFTEVLSESALRGYMTRSANFKRVTFKNDELIETIVPPPLDVVRDIHSLGDWSFPPLLGITESPVIRPDGTIVTQPGYDSLTNLYYNPSPKLSVPPIPGKPSDTEIKAAIDLVLEPLADLPFDSEASRANAIATMFTPILMPMINAPAPLSIFDKPQAGTGATKLAEVISLIATGRITGMLSPPKSDEEWQKIITVQLLKGQPLMVIDNVEAKLESASLGTLLTADTWRGRILGRSDEINIPNRLTIIATGNNIKLGGDLPRRCIWVRMDAKMARPWQRDVNRFKHPRLIQWVSENRGSILAAILTIARAWVVASMLEARGLPNLGGYEDYCRVVGGVLAFMGVAGFLDNLNAMYDETDTETPQWQSFLEVWREFVGDEPATVAEVIKLLSENDDFNASLPDSLADRDTRDYSRRLGNALSKHNGVRYPNGLMITKTGQKKRAITWQVVSYQNANSPSFSFGSELGELSTTPALTENARTNKNIYKNAAETNSPNSSNSPDNIPNYPTHPCHNCGCGDYWLRETSEWGKAEWLCLRCHPKPEGGNS